MSHEYSTPPSGVGIRVVDASSKRLVISIPPGGKRARGIGCFAFAWLAITIPVSCVFLLVDDANWEGGEAPPLIFMIPFFGIFWAVGIGMLIAWLRMRFTQIYLAVEPEQFAIQKTLFGRKKLTKLTLDQNSHAELVESYSENDNPVYTIQVEGVSGKEKFATGISYDEKRWLATTINQFLGVGSGQSGSGYDTDSMPEYCGECGTKLMTGEDKRVCPECGKAYFAEESDETSSTNRIAAATDPRGQHSKITERPRALEPYALPDDSLIRIDHDDGETLAFSYPVRLPGIVKYPVGGFLLFFCCAWYGGVSTFILAALSGDEPMGVKIGIVLFASVFLFAGLMPLGLLLALFFGRVRIRIDREILTGSIGVLFVRKKKSVSIESITDVGLSKATMSTRRAGRHHAASVPMGMKGCMLTSSESNMPLSMSSDQRFNEQVAGLVRFQLHRAGVDLAHG